MPPKYSPKWFKRYCEKIKSAYANFTDTTCVIVFGTSIGLFYRFTYESV